MPQIQKADPKTRRKAILSLAIGALVGTALFLVFDHFIGNFNQWIENNAEFLIKHHYVAFLIMLLPVAPVIALCAYLIVYAGKVVKAERFPPPDTSIIRDIRIIEGKAAVIRGRVAQVLCWIILLSASAIPLLIWIIFYNSSCSGNCFSWLF